MSKSILTVAREHLQGNAQVDEAVAKARQRLERGGDPHQVLEALSHELTNKLLHPLIQSLKAASRPR